MDDVTTPADVVRACSLSWLPIDVGAPQRDTGGGSAWQRVRELTGSAALARWFEAVLTGCDGHRDVATAFLAARCAWPLARLTVVPALTRQRALVFVPQDLWFRVDRRGLVTSVRVEDPAVEDPVLAGPRSDVSGAPAVDAHAARLAVEGYRPVVDGLRAIGALGERALWGQLADTLVAAVGDVVGDSTAPASAAERADLLLRAADPPLWVRAEFARVVRRGGAGLAWRRGSCCLAYRLPGYGVCNGCPLQSRAEWLARSSVEPGGA